MLLVLHKRLVQVAWTTARRQCVGCDKRTTTEYEDDNEDDDNNDDDDDVEYQNDGFVFF